MQTKLWWRMGVVLACMMIGTGAAQAQLPDITAFSKNGELTWTNSDSTVFYQVQWAASLTGTNVWQSDYSTLQDIQTTNASVTIKVPVFYRVEATSNRVVYAAPVARTGQTTSFWTGDDGDLKQGVAWPDPRFQDNSDGTVIDNLTGLIWLKNASAAGSSVWETALTNCAALKSGEMGLSDGSQAGDWRLPNVRELLSLVDYGRINPMLPRPHPFTNVRPASYWSSTTSLNGQGVAWLVSMLTGPAIGDDKTTANWVWPVRGAL